MRPPGVIPHRYDWKLLRYPVIGLPVLFILLGGLALPLVSYLRSLEANAAMAATPAPIDGKRAFGYLEKICAIGPRVAGSEANTRQRQMVAAHFKSLGATLREQPFSTQHPETGERVNMAN